MFCSLVSPPLTIATLQVDDGDKIPPFARRKALMTPRLESLLGKRALSSAPFRRDLGELTHVFSHVKHHMGVEHVHLASPPADQSDNARDKDKHVRWMTVDEMDTRGITTGVKKVLQLVLKPDAAKRKAAAKKKTTATSSASKRSSAHVADGAKRAKTIATFFNKL